MKTPKIWSFQNIKTHHPIKTKFGMLITLAKQLPVQYFMQIRQIVAFSQIDKLNEIFSYRVFQKKTAQSLGPTAR